MKRKSDRHLPPSGKAARYLSPIKALPLVKAKLRNPRLIVAGKTIIFPVELETGGYLEFRSMADCRLYGPDGTLLPEVKPEGAAPILNAGPNSVAFACDPPPGYNLRVRVTTMTAGAPLAEAARNNNLSNYMLGRMA